MMASLNNDGCAWCLHGAVPIGSAKSSKPFLLAALACALLMMAYMNMADGSLELESMSRYRMLSEEQINEEDADVDPADGPTFVFVMGVEGTGHHLLEQLLGQSPTINKMKELGSCGNGGELETISNTFSAVGGLFHPTLRTNQALDSRMYVDFVVDKLRSLRDKVKEDVRKAQEEENSETESEEGGTVPSPSSLPMNIPINSNGCPDQESQMSYPSLLGPDRALQNFNLRIFYNACARAKVNCEHVYIYRNPYDVIKSTSVNRRYNKSIMDAIRLYTVVTQIVHSQLVSYPNRNAGCFGFLDQEGAMIEEDWIRFWKLFGWKDTESFMKVLGELNDKSMPQAMSAEAKASLVPARMGVLMDALEQIHYQVVDYCYSSLNSREEEMDMNELVAEEFVTEQLAAESGGIKVESETVSLPKFKIKSGV